MLAQSVMYMIFKGAAIAASVIFMKRTGARMDNMLILVLVFSCILTSSCLIDRISRKYKKKLQSTLNIIMLFIVFFLDVKNMFPLLAILLIHLIDDFAWDNYFYYLTIGMLALTMIIINPQMEVAAFSVLLIILLYYTREVRNKAQSSRKLVLEQKEEMVNLNQKLFDNRRLAKTLQYTAALEERNRLAARLHDKVGHGISGSIILLEASRLMLDQNMEKAKAGIDLAVNNLRSGVDEIRLALREEKPIRSELGLHELQMVLENLQANHNIRTKLKQSGNIDYIGVGIWQCIHENLEEAITNTLKHSNAAEFKLSIQVMNRIIKVEYSDNGKSEGNFQKGLGLEAMEERTLKNRGRCFFDKSENGFQITNIFTY